MYSKSILQRYLFIIIIFGIAIEGILIYSFFSEYQRMLFFSKFSKSFKDTTLTGVALYNILNSLRTRILKNPEIINYNYAPLMEYSDNAIFKSVETAVNSYIVNLLPEPANKSNTI